MKTPTTLVEQEVIDGVDYPYRDGKPMAESAVHLLLMLTLIPMLRWLYQGAKDVWVGGDIFLYYEKGDTTKKVSPDILVAKCVVSDPLMKSYKLWVEKVVPCVVIELTSESTADEDQGVKKAIYEQLGVREYFLFDPLGDYLPRPLVGYRLVAVAENGNGDDPNLTEVHHHYEELPPDADGGMPSAELGLRLVPNGQELDLIELRTGKRLATPDEVREQLGVKTSQLQDRDRQLQDRDRQLQDREQENELLRQQLADLRARQSGTPPPQSP